MATTQFGIGGYLAELVVDGGSAKFHFVDPDDATNTQDVTLSESDFNGFPATSAQVSEIAFNKARKTLDDAKDNRIKRTAADDLARKTAAEAAQRDAAIEHFATAQDVTVEPTKTVTDSEGNVVSRVYSGGDSIEAAPSNSPDDKKGK